MPEKPQSAASHAKLDPIFHFFMLPVALINVCVEIYAVILRPSYSELWFLVLSIVFFLAILKIRTNALKVQDRVIRLEETIRMHRVLPVEMHRHVENLRPGQFIALRFAPDGELPGLVEQTVANNWGAKDIKGAIQNWRPDHFRV